MSEKGVYCLTRPIGLNYPNPLTTKKLKTTNSLYTRTGNYLDTRIT